MMIDMDKEAHFDALFNAHEEISCLNQEKKHHASKLEDAYTEIAFHIQEKERCEAELAIANSNLIFQNKEKEKLEKKISVTSNDLKNAEATICTLNKKLEQSKRLAQHAFLNQVNQSIAPTKDGESLFQKTCDSALKFGNYQMAWIGSFDLAQKQITLLDSCGIPDQDIKLFREIPYETKAAQSHVLRTGTHFLCNDVKKTLAIGDWKPFVENHNIGSFIVLPIKKSGTIFGTCNFYATEPNYFGEEDIALLEEVTNDISYALALIDTAESHQEVERELNKIYTALNAQSKEQSAILNSLPASIAILDNEGTIVKVNEEWIRFGQANGMRDTYSHLRKNYIEISEKSSGKDSKYGKKMAQGLREILCGERDSFSMEYPCDSAGETSWFKAEVRPFKSSLLTGAVVMHINISERKKAEAELLLLINNTEEAYILVNKNLEIVSYNNQFKNLYATYLGVEIQKGVSILDYAQPERRQTADTIYKKVLEGHVEESEIMFLDANLSTTYYSKKYSPAKDDSGAVFGAFVTAIDITDKKKAKEQKDYERRNKEALINSTTDLIWSISTDHKLIAANDAFLKQMKEFIGVDIKPGEDLLSFEALPNASLKYWKHLYRRALLGESFKIEIHNPPSPGMNESWIDTSFNPIFDNEQIAGIACYSRNITDRKKAENLLTQTSKELQHAVNELNKVMDSSLDVICAVDANGTFLKVSGASKAVWGYTPAELIGTPIFKLVYHEDLQKTRASSETVMSGNQLNHFENRYVRKDGTLVPIEWSARWDAIDQIRYGVARDVSEKKRLKESVEKERQRFYNLFSEAPSSMGVLRGPNHIFEIVNPPLLQLIGKTDIIGKTVKEVLPEVFNQGFIKLLDEVYTTGNTFSSSEVLMKLDTHGTGQLDDKYLNLMYRAHRTKTDTIDGILFFAIDVTEQVLLRKEIEEGEAKLKQSQALLRISNWEIDLITHVSTWSEECYAILGLRREDLQPSLHAFLSMIHPDDFELAKVKVEETFETFEAGSFSARINKDNGDLTYVYAEWKFEVDTNDKPIRLYGILQDITERKIAEEERLKITNDLFQRNRDLEQFTFIISHNLRAPAANIMGFTEYFQDETITPNEQKELLKGLASSVSGLDSIIKDINSILQVKRGINDNKEIVPFSKLVTDIINSIGSTIEKHKVQISTDFDEVDNIFSLKVYLHSIFYNLISNSIKYRKPNEQPLIEIKSKKENDKIILTFKDNGLGFDLHKKGDKIFGLYQRFHNHVEGKGMGLFMVKTQVEAIGGKITVASEPNNGSEFTIIFEN